MVVIYLWMVKVGLTLGRPTMEGKMEKLILKSKWLPFVLTGILLIIMFISTRFVLRELLKTDLSPRTEQTYSVFNQDTGRAPGARLWAVWKKIDFEKLLPSR